MYVNADSGEGKQEIRNGCIKQFRKSKFRFATVSKIQTQAFVLMTEKKAFFAISCCCRRTNDLR
jgi:hypothetical protein